MNKHLRSGPMKTGTATLTFGWSEWENQNMVHIQAPGASKVCLMVSKSYFPIVLIPSYYLKG